MFAVVLRRLQSDTTREIGRSPFEPLAIPAYTVVAAQLVLATMLFPITGFTFSFAMVLPLPLPAPYLSAPSLLVRRYDHSRISGWLGATALIYAQGLTTLSCYSR